MVETKVGAKAVCSAGLWESYLAASLVAEMVEHSVEWMEFEKVGWMAAWKDMYWAVLRAAYSAALMVVQLEMLAMQKECLKEYYWVATTARSRVAD